MRFIDPRWAFLLLLIAGTACLPGQGPSTDLEIEVVGGFAYVYTKQEDMLEIAYLESTKEYLDGTPNPDCAVQQLGTDLQVISGNIVEPANAPADRMFDLGGAVVTFLDLDDNPPLKIVRKLGPPLQLQPTNRGRDAAWHDLKFVPGVSKTALEPIVGAQSKITTLKPNWRNVVNGRLVLKGGSVKGLHPSDVDARSSDFEFKDSSGNSFRQAITDRTQYTGRVLSDRVIVQLTGAASGITRIIVTPTANRRPVKLMLMGRHAPQTPARLTASTKVHHFCAFYELLEPPVAAADQLIPSFAGTIYAPSPRGQPSPGAFCPGGWF